MGGGGRYKGEGIVKAPELENNYYLKLHPLLYSNKKYFK